MWEKTLLFINKKLQNYNQGVRTEMEEWGRGMIINHRSTAILMPNWFLWNSWDNMRWLLSVL